MRVLLIDSYDSFTYNLWDLISRNIEGTIDVIHNDASFTEAELSEFFHHITQDYSCIIIGPGPGDPNDAQNLGLIAQIFASGQFDEFPILGICLGFQALGLNANCAVQRCHEIQHGQVEKVTLVDEPEGSTGSTGGTGGLFTNFPRVFNSVRYHSLEVTQISNSLVPLAYSSDGKVLMAARHRTRPHYGVQYHPESVCSDHGDLLIRNFAEICRDRRSYGTGPGTGHGTGLRTGHGTVPGTGPGSGQRCKYESRFVDPARRTDSKNATEYAIPSAVLRHHIDAAAVTFKTIQLPRADPHFGTRAYELFAANNDEVLLLNSSKEPGNVTILGAKGAGFFELTWTAHSPETVHVATHENEFSLPLVQLSIWEFLEHVMAAKTVARVVDLDVSFYGGLVGFLSYESGQFVDLDLLRQQRQEQQQQSAKAVPDIKLRFVSRTVQYDTAQNRVTVIGLEPSDAAWVHSTCKKLEEMYSGDTDTDTDADTDYELPAHTICRPDHRAYCAQFAECQRHLQTGNSYELCLCTQCRISFAQGVDSWRLYKRVNSSNPAPFSGFLKFHDCVLVASSPERFVSWKHETHETQRVQLRPIKGTLKKHASLTWEQVESALHSPKEVGENLMILDLIRNDLFCHCFSGAARNVAVPQLMRIEEYATVYQLVSVIECEIAKGQFKTGSNVRKGTGNRTGTGTGTEKENEKETDIETEKEKENEVNSSPTTSPGFRILASALPPGSMTGAPKKRSVEILQTLENRPRGIYSGVFGYWSVTDEADWSVVIRSLFTYDSELREWQVGAGGAITVLSTAEGEWDEMNVKLDSILQIFE